MKIFISHASEDKASFVRDLAEALRNRNIDVWYDEYVLTIGDSLREKIDEGLATCDYGVLVLSEAFFLKQWPKEEVNGLFARSIHSKRKLLLPIRHNISTEKILEYSPILADKFALSSDSGIGTIVKHILHVCISDEMKFRHGSSHFTYAHRYLKDPSQVPQIGYELEHGTFNHLLSQLRRQEIIITYGRPYGTYEVACHVMDEERMLELEKDFDIPPTYYAVALQNVIDGFDTPIPKEEL